MDFDDRVLDLLITFEEAERNGQPLTRENQLEPFEPFHPLLFARSATEETTMGKGSEQAVFVHLDGRTLPTELYAQYDLTDLEDQLEEAIRQAGLGVYDGNELGPGEVTLFMYGPDAEALYRVIEPILIGNPLCQNARIVICSGDPSGTGREIRLPRV